jgi:hypothetical protein
MSSTTVNFNLKTAGFANYANQTLTFKLLQVSADKADDTVILPGIVTATSAANGTGSAALFTTGESDIESTFEVIFPNREKGLFQIPATSAGGSINLSDLLVDHVPGGSAAPQNSIYDAAVAYSIQRGNHTGTQTISTISDATEGVEDIVGGMVTGNTETGITVTYQDSDGTLDFVVASQTDENFTTADHAKLDLITLPAGAGTTINAFARDSLLNSNATSIKSALGVADTSAIAGFVPKSITFPSASDFLSIADDNDLDVGTGDFTLSFWARLDGTGVEPILNKYSGAGYSLKFSSGELILTIQGTGDPLAVTLATGLNDNKWHVYVVSVDRDANAVAYVDNVAQTARDVSTITTSLDNSTAFRIGYDGANPSSEIAFGNYVALHKSALTASEAAQIYFSADAALTAVVPTLMVDLREVTETFTDVSASPLPIITNGTVRFNQDRLTGFTGTNVLATSTLGYTTGSGGTVTQASNKTTAVTLNKINGEIVMNGAALADDATAAFTLTNSTIAATDVVIVNVASVGTAGAYQVTVGAVAAGSCSISVLNVSGGSLSEAIKLNFAVIKAVAS